MIKTHIEVVELRFKVLSSTWKSLVEEDSFLRIKQGYPPELQDRTVEHRIRRITHPNGKVTYEQCERGRRNGVTTPEDKWTIKKPEGDQLFRECGKNFLVKNRWFIPYKHDGLEIEIDEFICIRGRDIRQDPLVIAEVKFENDAEAAKYRKQCPDIFGMEVTEKEQWTNFFLCHNGIPINGKK